MSICSLTLRKTHYNWVAEWLQVGKMENGNMESGNFTNLCEVCDYLIKNARTFNLTYAFVGMGKDNCLNLLTDANFTLAPLPGWELIIERWTNVGFLVSNSYGGPRDYQSLSYCCYSADDVLVVSRATIEKKFPWQDWISNPNP